jgi:probable HAF family extracellular repeat protein
MLKSWAIAVVALFLPSCAAAQPPAAASFTVTNIGLLPGYTDSIGFAINDAGEVAGTLQMALPEGAIDHAFFYTGGHIVDLGILPGGPASDGFALNNCGEVLASGNQSLVLYSHGTLFDLGAPPPPSSVLFQAEGGINDAGEILGDATSNISPYPSFAALYNQAGGWVDLAVPALYSGVIGTAINNSGEIAGGGTLATGANNSRALTYIGGVWTDLGTVPGLPNSSGYALNNLGQVTGVAGNDAGTVNHIILYSGGTMTDLGTLPGDIDADGYGINDFTEVVGDSIGAALIDRAVYYSATTGLADLNTLIPPGSGWQLTQALGINRHGQITGWGMFDGQGLAFVLTPVPTQTLINSVNGLIAQLECPICHAELSDLIHFVPPSLTDLTPRQKEELRDNVGRLISVVRSFVGQQLVTPDAGRLVVHQGEELLAALRAPKGIITPTTCNLRASA